MKFTKFILFSIVTSIGMAAHASLSVLPSFVSFGEVEINGIQHTQSVSVYNWGTDPASITINSLCAPYFNVMSLSCFGQLSPNGSCSIQIQFTPQQAGTYSCQIYVGFQSVSVNATAVEAPKSATTPEN